MKLMCCFLAALVLFSAGCASTSPKVDWDTRVGLYTYHEAVEELGKPDFLEQSSSGITAEWILRRGSQISFGFGVGTGSYGHGVATGVGVGTSVTPRPRGEYLVLKFDAEDKLKEWRMVKY